MTPRLTYDDLLLLRAIDLADPDVSNNKLADALGRKSHRIGTSITGLVEQGYVCRCQQGGRRRLEVLKRPKNLTQCVVSFDPPAPPKIVGRAKPHAITHRRLTSRDERRERICLGCRIKFHSSWCGNRLCNSCNERYVRDRTAIG